MMPIAFTPIVIDVIDIMILMIMMTMACLRLNVLRMFDIAAQFLHKLDTHHSHNNQEMEAVLTIALNQFWKYDHVMFLSH